MGLDMYLVSRKKDDVAEALIRLYAGNIAKEHPKIFQALKDEGYVYTQGSESYQYDSFTCEQAYWRKANQIHLWFVKNIQNGVDDCGYYPVSSEKLKELLDLCRSVIKKDEKGPEIIREKAETLLPPQSGFFFGSIAIDEYYLVDIMNTIIQLETILNNFDFEHHVLMYHSSW